MSASNILLNGTTSNVNTFNGTTKLTKTGTGNDLGTGGNRFNGVTTLTNSASSGTFESANSYYDIFNADLTLTCTSTAGIPIADNATGNLFNGNIIVNSSGGDISFCNGNGGTVVATATLAEGKTITAGTFTAGGLYLERFTQGTVVGGTAQTLTLTGTAILSIGEISTHTAPSSPNTTFNGAVTFKAPQIYLNGGTYNSTAYLEKTGATSNPGFGANVFNGVTTLVNSGSGWFESAVNTADTFNGDVTLTNTGSSIISMAASTSGNAFNGNILVNCTGSSTGTGIRFANNTSTGAATLASGKTIKVGSTGFSVGTLTLQKFTQLGTTSQALTLTGTATLTLGISSVFNGNVTFVSPRVLLNGTTYNGTAYIEQNGNTGMSGDGGNTFNGATTIVNSGTSYLTSANSNPDTFNGVLTLTNTGSNGLYIADKAAGNVFNNNIIVNSTAGNGVYFCNNSSATASLASGKTITVGTSFTTGTLGLIRFTQLGSATQTLTLTGTSTLTVGPSSTFNGNVTFKSPQVYLQGCTYNGTTYIEKTGATSNLGNGGNTFNATTTLVNSGSGYFATAFVSPDIFNADVTATNTGSSWVALSDNAVGTQFNGNIIVNSTNSTSFAGITFGNGPGSSMTCTLASGKTISVGGTGFTAGRLRLRGFIQNGSTSQSLTLTGTAQLLVGNLSTFNGNVTFKAPQLYLDGCTYNGTAYLEKTGATNNLATLAPNTFNSTATIVNSGSGYLRTNGGNIFNGTTTVTNSGSSDILLEQTTAGTYNGDVTFTNSGSSVIWTAYTGANAFNGNIIVNSTAGIGITFCGSTGTATLANTKTITVGSSGFSAGTLILQRFTQSGTTSQSVTFTGTANLTIGPSSTFNGNVTFSSPTLFLNGCAYKGTSSFTKTGSTTDNSVGGNVFTGISSVTNSGSGILRLANTTADNFTTNLDALNNGTGSLEIAYNSSGNLFGNNVTLTNNGSGSSSSVSISANSGSTSTITGDLSITNSGSATNNLCYVANNGSVAVTGNTSLLNSASGAASNINICAGSSGATAIFNGAFTSTSNATATTSVVWILKGTVTFNGDVIINNTSTSSGTNGFFIGASGNTGSATLASGKTISIGSTGFSTGTLQLYNFTQNGSTAQNIALTGSANLALGLASLPVTFNGALTFSTTGTATITSSIFNSTVTGTSSSIIITNNTFSGATSLTKNGTSNDDTNGGNIFNGSASFTTTNTGRWRLGSSTVDDYNGVVTFLQNGSGLLQPSYTNSSTYAGDISTIGSGSSITFGSNSGRVIIDGSSAQTWNGDATNKPSVTKLTMQTGGSALTLGVPVDITTDLTLTTGIINATTTNYLNFADNATVTGASNSSYVNGPVRKTGNDAFVFPVGKSNLYRAIAMSAPSLTTDQFTAQYFYTAQTYGGSSTWDPSLYNISQCDYWILDRTTGTSAVTVKLSWDDSSCPGGTGYIKDLNDLRVARFNSATSTWMNEGNGGTTGSTSIGTVISGAAVTSFSPFAIATVSSSNPLPIELRFFKASAERNNKVILTWETATEKNNDFFTIERSIDGETFESIKKIDGAGNSSLPIDYASADNAPLGGLSYYRLKQTDFDGGFSYSRIVAVQIDASSTLYLYPNPSAGGEFFVQLSEQNDGSSKITISDAKGVIVYYKSVEMSNGLIHVEKPENLSSGFYTVYIEGNGEVHTYKLIVN
jgi:hypothetical protein